MSIADVIERAKASGKLVPFQPFAEWEGSPRALLMCKQLCDQIESGKGATHEKDRQVWASLEAAFASFVEGGLITGDMLKQLQPPKQECWEFRIRKPRPALRAFGRFALPDVFVATHAVPRKVLGGMNSAQFEHEKLVCEEYWRGAGLPDNPFTDKPGFRYTAYIPFNAREKLEI